MNISDLWSQEVLFLLPLKRRKHCDCEKGPQYLIVLSIHLWNLLLHEKPNRGHSGTTGFRDSWWIQCQGWRESIPNFTMLFIGAKQGAQFWGQDSALWIAPRKCRVKSVLDSSQLWNRSHKPPHFGFHALSSTAWKQNFIHWILSLVNDGPHDI